MQNVYEQVTDRIIAQLELGNIPWRKEWKVSGHSSIPSNYTTKKPYRGINILLLLSCAFDGDARFLTYKQAQGIGAQAAQRAQRAADRIANRTQVERETSADAA
jgi:antirestriction protein ArdC